MKSYRVISAWSNFLRATTRQKGQCDSLYVPWLIEPFHGGLLCYFEAKPLRKVYSGSFDDLIG
jgi:hypothetical protein